MGKSTEPPKCKNCGEAHRGPCWSPLPETSVGLVVTYEQLNLQPQKPKVEKRIDDPVVKRGRPATGFDKKAYDRQKAAERRAKLKESK